jgi:mercuric ion transport protein
MKNVLDPVVTTGCNIHVNQESLFMNNSSTNSCCEPARTLASASANVAIGRTEKLVAAGGILGAIAASSCCIAPLVLFSLGISGAWIGNLTALAPYQPYFIAATLACLGYGYWLVYRPRKVACAEGAACARPLPNRFVLFGLILATVLLQGRWPLTSLHL